MPPNPLSLYQSSGQTFTQRGRPSRAGRTLARDAIGDFQGAIEDMAALSARLLAVGPRAAVELADALTDNTKAAIRRHMPRGTPQVGRTTTGEPFEFSKGRLAAAWGRYTPNDIRGVSDADGSTPIQTLHEQWADENGVADNGSEGDDQIGTETVVEMGALTEIKRLKGNVWSAEVGTFLPYAGLANDGGSMLIHPYGNRRAQPVEAIWEGVHFIEEGVANTEGSVDGIVEGSIQSALDAQPTRRKMRNPGRRRRG